MHGNINQSHAIVPPHEFSERMAIHWTETLHLCASPALRTLWRIMAETFATAIEETASGIISPWRVLQPPTGSGKTQGACLYAAMQADANLQDGKSPVGILIVTRLIEQADRVTATINRLAGRNVAVASHSESRASPEEMSAADVVVITHAAYVTATGSRAADRQAAWTRLLSWRFGSRLLTIVDEALANTIAENKVTVDGLARLLAYIPPHIATAYPDQVKVLRDLHHLLTVVASIEIDAASVLMWTEDFRLFQAIDMSAFRSAMRQIMYDRIVMQRTSLKDRQQLAKLTDDLLRDAEVVLNQFAYFSEQGSEHSLNTSSLLVPQGMPGPVVLDATARANFLWDLFEDRALIIPTPSHTRDYCNVTLHVARAIGLGKTKMLETAEDRWPRTLDAVQKELSPERSLLAITHKAVKYIVLSHDTHFRLFSAAHWRAVDGRNDWAEYDAAVIFGLPYRDGLWANNAFFALHGVQGNAWLREPKWKEHQNVRKVMEQRQLSVAVIQAVNRICCRRVIDPEGRSPAADIFIILPKDKTGDAILQDILADMPNLTVVNWAFELEGEKVQRPRRRRSGTSHEALLALMDNRLPGEVSMTGLGKELGLTPTGLKKLREALRDPDHPTTQTLATMGVTFVSRGSGRGTVSYLVKADD